MDKPAKTLENKTALRVIKNERLLCENCLKSGPLEIPRRSLPVDEYGDVISDKDTDVAIYCYLDSEPQIKAKTHYCTQGLWMINGKVVDFKEGFQMIYDKKGGGHPKEIQI